MLLGKEVEAGRGKILAQDYCEPRHHIGFARAIGRRLGRNYVWILGIQTLAYYGKIAIHPEPIASLAQLVRRASLGPIPGEIMLLCGMLFTSSWIAFAVVTFFLDRAKHGARPNRVAMGQSIVA